ncbi:MAG: MFS transporter [Fibrobacteraceae bacterium]
MEKIWTKPFINICTTNFLLFFAFYLILPILPLYITEEFKAGKTVSGIVLAAYTAGALISRPFAGYFVDSFNRKKLFLISYILYSSIFIGYFTAGFLALLAFTRFVHGIVFGSVSTTSNTIAVDLLPSARRGEGIGYYGVAFNIAFALGPMTGAFICEKWGFDAVFYTSLAICTIGTFLAIPLKTKQKAIKKDATPISFDRFFLTSAVPQFLCLIFVGFAYGPVINYLTLYGNSVGVEKVAGPFYSLIAVGLISSRLLIAKHIDRGYIIQIIAIGTLILASAFGILGFFHYRSTFFVAALLIGIGNGMICPSYQTLFVNMARHNQRGTASSTYLTGWDVGIGTGILLGGIIAEHLSYGAIFAISAFVVFIGAGVFYFFAAPHYNAHKLENA